MSQGSSWREETEIIVLRLRRSIVMIMMENTGEIMIFYNPAQCFSDLSIEAVEFDGSIEFGWVSDNEIFRWAPRGSGCDDFLLLQSVN